MDALHLLSDSVTPLVLMSACGLITPALYNRLGAIVARIRAFHQQKIELLTSPRVPKDGSRHMLMQLIDSQIAGVTVKAKTIQKGLYCLLSATMAFLLCSLLTAATRWHESVAPIALGMHILGMILFLLGIGCAMRELTLSITPLEEESAYLEMLTEQQLAKSQDDEEPRILKIA